MIELKGRFPHPTNQSLRYDLKYAKRDKKRVFRSDKKCYEDVDDFVIGYKVYITNDAKKQVNVGFDSESYLTDFHALLQKKILVYS